jgi:hypothetical protein
MGKAAEDGGFSRRLGTGVSGSRAAARRPVPNKSGAANAAPVALTNGDLDQAESDKLLEQRIGLPVQMIAIKVDVANPAKIRRGRIKGDANHYPGTN